MTYLTYRMLVYQIHSDQNPGHGANLHLHNLNFIVLGIYKYFLLSIFYKRER